MAAGLTRVEGTAVPFLESNIDTDRIIPGEWMMRAHLEGFAKGLFAAERYRPDGSDAPGFVLNRAPWCRASILLAGQNFGCGSTREEAPLALFAFGFRCLIAPSFANVFFSNCFRVGILPVRLPLAVVRELAAMVEASAGTAVVTVDLEAETVTAPDGSVHGFQSPPRLRRMLMLGVDEIGLTMAMLPELERFRAADRQRRPWAYPAA